MATKHPHKVYRAEYDIRKLHLRGTELEVVSEYSQ
jgi:hypothetical protein